MIKIRSASQQEEIVKLLNAFEGNEMEFSFIKQDGSALYFETNSINLEEAAREAKMLIKSEPWGSILDFESVPA